jgi:thermitase
VNAYKTVTAAAVFSPDVTAPTVSIASPAPSTILSGTVSVSGTATDPSGISKCSLYVDNALMSSQGGYFNFNWDSRNVANGTHTVAVSCTDAAANVGQTGINVSVSNATPVDAEAPTLAIVSPTAWVTIPDQVTISVSASDNVGVSQLSIYIDNVLVSSSSSTSSNYVWNTKNASAGFHTITARAWDRAGNAAAKAISVKH